jgi:hypothetical protein
MIAALPGYAQLGRKVRLSRKARLLGRKVRLGKLDFQLKSDCREGESDCRGMSDWGTSDCWEGESDREGKSRKVVLAKTVLFLPNITLSFPVILPSLIYQSHFFFPV